MARRKKQDEAERLTEFFGFQVTPSQKAELERRALLNGRSPSDFARRVLLSDEKAPAPTARDPAVIRALVAAIKQLGNNHNQITKLGNEARSLPYAKDRQAASEALAAAFAKGEFQAVSAAIIAALDRVMEL
jgi:hypothetical protein